MSKYIDQLSLRRIAYQAYVQRLILPPDLWQWLEDTFNEAEEDYDV